VRVGAVRKIMMFRKLLPLALVAGLVSNIFATPAKSAENLRADVINVYFDPDFPLPAGQSLLTHYQSKKYVYLYREIIPVEVGGNTYFAMLGANGGYPDFYGGIQYFEDGSKAAIFSAWLVQMALVQPAYQGQQHLKNKFLSGPRVRELSRVPLDTKARV
jgi:hypothetical protein